MKLGWALRAILYKIKFKKFGNLSYIGKPIYLVGVNKGVVGSKVRIFPNLRMEIYGRGGVLIEDDVSIGQNLHIISSDSLLTIGKSTTISGNVLITNIDHEYSKIGIHIMEQSLLTRETKIGENCFIGYGAIIQAGTVLGKQCIVGANSVVRGKFPDYCVIVGAPARIVKKYNPISREWEKVL